VVRVASFLSLAEVTQLRDAISNMKFDCGKQTRDRNGVLKFLDGQWESTYLHTDNVRTAGPARQSARSTWPPAWLGHVEGELVVALR